MESYCRHCGVETITETEWASANVKRSRKEIDPFTLEEANTIINRLHEHKHWPSRIYAALFEFMFFTGIRLSEALAVQWDVIDMEKRTVHVRRAIALCVVEERTKPRGIGTFC